MTEKEIEDLKIELNNTILVYFDKLKELEEKQNKLNTILKIEPQDKIMCVCGGLYSRNKDRLRHERTRRHQEYMKDKPLM
jgi:hypothetical protein